MKNQYDRQILTGLTGLVNNAILDSVMGQLSDGKWENSPAMRKYWEHAEIAELNGQLVIMISDDFGSGFRGMDGDAIRAKFASWLKAIVYDETGGGRWEREDKSELDYLSRGKGQEVTVADAYRAYDILKGREIRTPNPLAVARKAAQAAKDKEIALVEARLAMLKAERAAL